MNIYPEKFEEKMLVMKTDKEGLNSEPIGNKLENSEGIAIIQINYCFESYDELRVNICGLYESTLAYLNSVKETIDKCEEDNTMLASSDEEG